MRWTRYDWAFLEATWFVHSFFFQMFAFLAVQFTVRAFMVAEAAAIAFACLCAWCRTRRQRAPTIDEIVREQMEYSIAKDSEQEERIG